MPTNTAVPTISGAVGVGSTAVSSNGTWTTSGLSAFTFQWQKSSDGLSGWASVVGEVGSSISPTIALLGQFLRCQVTCTDTGGSASVYTAATISVYLPWPLTPQPSYYSKSNWLQSGYNRNGVFYSGDTVIVPRDVVYHTTDPSTADFETGVNGANLTSLDPGSHTPFSVFGPAAIVYDNTHADGNLSMKFPTGSGSKIVFASNVPLDGKTHAGRFRFYATANPTSNTSVVVISANNNPSNPTIATISITTTGKINVNTGVFHLSTMSIPLNQWFRCEWKIVNDTSSGSIIFRIFSGTNDVSPAETITITGLALQDVSTYGAFASFGVTEGGWGGAFWMDDVAQNAADWIGPGAVTFPTFTRQYEVRDYYGNVVSSGNYDEPECRPTAPLGGWKPGWYRIYFTGAGTDSIFGSSCGLTQFAVIRSDSHFVPMPSGTTSGGVDTTSDLVMKGVLGLGTSRLGVPDVTNLNGSNYPIASAAADASIAATYWVNPGSPYADANRPRYQWVNFSAQTWDYLAILNGVANQSWGWVTCKDGTVDGSTIFITVGAGSVSGTKIKVFAPDSSTLVETYDNLASPAAAVTAINGVSTRIWFLQNEGGTATAISTPTAIGNTYFNGVKSAVTTLYADGITYFEGPQNEPHLDSALNGARVAQMMRLFQGAVHAGNASAKAIGPCPVNIDAASFDHFLAAGGGAYCDEFTFHAYNGVDADINIGKFQLAALNTLLSSYGYGSKVKWQTESTQGSSAISVFVPRKNVRWYVWNVLLLEQYGFARERNNPWYDKSVGFWSFPAFLRTSDGGLMPQAVVGRVLAEETWGKPYASALDFGTIGNKIFLGSVYTNPSDATSTIVLLPTSTMDAGQVTLSISGTSSPLTIVDGFGNSSTATISGGLVTVAVTELPTYVQLPAGASATVHSCNDWSSTSLTEVTTSAANVGGVSTALPIDNLWMTSYNGSAGNAFISANTPPENVTITLASQSNVDRVIIWSGFAWQNHCSLIDFDVQTSLDGSSWATQVTVNKSSVATSFLFGSAATNTGTAWETYWPEHWVFDVPFPSSVPCNYIRLVVRQTSQGGLPNTQTGNGPFQDFGVWQPQHVTIQEVKVIAAVSGGGGGGPAPDGREAIYTAAPYNWVFYNTKDGWGAHRRQEGGFVECIGSTKTIVLDRIDEYEAQLAAKGVPVSNEWGELYGSTSDLRAKLISKGKN